MLNKNYYELRECLKHLEEYSIFEFMFPDNPKIFTFSTQCHEDSYNFTMFLFKLKKEINGFEIVSVNHFKNGNQIASHNVSRLDQIPQEIKNKITMDITNLE